MTESLDDDPDKHHRPGEHDDSIVRTFGLTKRYGEFEALVDCNVRAARGEIFGLLGPNGAGKTTLVRLMLGFLQPTEGYSQIDGFDPKNDGVELRTRVAYLPGDARLPRHLRGAAVLRMFAELHPEGDLDRSKSIADQLELDTSRRVAFMSTGMRQKLALAVVLGLKTPLLILDEPTANLDPTVRGRVLDLVIEARRQGRTVLFSSHVMSEIEETCDRVAFLRKGRLVHQLTMSDLFQRHRVTADKPASPLEVPAALRDQIQVSSDDQHLRLDTAGDLAPLLSWIDSLQLKHLRIEPLGLRAVYDSVHMGESVTAEQEALS
jgi:ABC-2 type transport system ATP-binding protein